MNPLPKTLRWLLPTALIPTLACVLLLLLWPAPGSAVAARIDAWTTTVFLLSGMWALFFSVRAYPTRVAASEYAVFLALVIAIIIWILDRSLSDWFLSDAVYRQWKYETRWVRLVIAFLSLGWLALVGAYRKRLTDLESALERQTDAGVLLREAELHKLRQQFQPHFLYNSLNAINALIMISPDKAQEMIGQLSDFLRNSVRREAHDTVPFTNELQYIEAYLAIEAIRFGDRLSVSFEKEDTDHAQIPSFVLQPLLENAVKFGVYGTEGLVEIKVISKLEGSNLLLSVSNPYDPTAQPPKGTGFGLDGIRRRLELLYGRADLLQTQQEGSLFTTTLRIPQIYA